MAYVLRQRLGLDEEDPLKKQGLSGPSMASPGSIAPPAGVALANPAAPGAGKQVSQSGGGWVNLQKYLNVAGGQGKQMAQGLAGQVGAEGAKFQQGLGDLQAQHAAGLKQDVAKGQDVRFGSMASMSGFGEVAGQADKASQQAKQLVDFSGRRDLLQQQANSTAGESRFDSFLAGAAGAKELQGAYDQYGGLAGKLGLANDASAEAARQAQDQVLIARGAAGPQVAAPKVWKPIEPEVSFGPFAAPSGPSAFPIINAIKGGVGPGLNAEAERLAKAAEEERQALAGLSEEEKEKRRQKAERGER